MPELTQSHKDLIITYAKVATRIVEEDLDCPHIKFSHEMEAEVAIKQKFQAFLQNPTKENFSSFWKRLQLLLGHSSLAVTQEYLQFRDADIMDAYNSVDFGSV